MTSRENSKLIVTVKAERLTGDGATIGTLGKDSGELSGKKCFIWGALPGETVEVEIINNRSKFCTGIVESVIEKSENRVEPKDAEFIHTSPWQTYSRDYETDCKLELIKNAFAFHKVMIPSEIEPRMIESIEDFHYRNKYTFYFTKDFKLATPSRENANLIEANSFSLTKTKIVESAKEVQSLLLKSNLPQNLAHSLLVRIDGKGEIFKRLYVQETLDRPAFLELKQLFLNKENFSIAKIALRKQGASFEKEVVFSSKKQTNLENSLCGENFTYSISSFFQTNQKIYEQFLSDLRFDLKSSKKRLKTQFPQIIVDSYCGVGTIGLTLISDSEIQKDTRILKLIEIDRNNIKNLEENVKQIAKKTETKIQAIHSSLNKATQFIETNCVLLVDPPRSGLDPKVREQISKVTPKVIAYLSCNPMTQARDVSEFINSGYSIKEVRGYNFFPKTAHVESFVLLEKQ